MGRITGKEGALFLSLTGTLAFADKIADIYDWTFEFTQAYESCPIKGETHDTVALGGITTRLTAGRYVETGSNPTRLADYLSGNAPASGNNYLGAPVEYRLEQIAGAAALNTGAVAGAVITGTGVVVRGSLSAPRGMAVDSLEIMGTTLPTVT
jgi:hypothetical protein